MNTTRFLVTGFLAILFSSLQFAAMTPTALQDARTQPTMSQVGADQARLASAHEKVCPALNSLGCP
jgi:hypothetical protein